MMRDRRWSIPVSVGGLMALLVLPVTAAAAPQSGEAMVVAHAGSVRARYPVGPVHEGRTESQDLFTGASVGERTRITTGRDGHLCLVLSPGALMHVPPNSQLTLTRLRHTADGLPRREADLVRQISVQLDRGGVYIDGGAPTPSLDIRVGTEAGEVLANGAVFSIVRGNGDDAWSVLCHAYEVDLLPRDAGARHRIAEGQSGWLTPNRVERDAPQFDREQHAFNLCLGYFRDLEAFRHPIRGFERQAIADYIGLSGQPVFIGDTGPVTDVSPSFRPPPSGATVPITPAAAGAPDGRRWGHERIWAWWDQVGVIRGVNYIPRNCVNSVEMWMDETFDTAIIDEELQWARGLGYTSVRVILQQVVWQDDSDGFLDRLDRFLELAANNGLTVVPVLFDDLDRAGQAPAFGPQPQPVPDTHNARWVPSPGATAVTDRARWPELEAYVRAVVETFKSDRRILYWDLYNTAGNNDLWEQSLPLMDQVFNWVRDIDPRQPLAVAAWKEFGSPMAARKLERSDLVTFQSFEHKEALEARLTLLQRYDRPIVASNWLMRQTGNTFAEILPVYAAYGVGWFNQGLVQGRTQSWIQDAAVRNPEAPDIWQHDVLKVDGSPYDEDEVELIRGFRFTKGQ